MFSFRSIINFELIFMKYARSVSRYFFFCIVDVCFFQRHLLKKLSLFY